MPISGTLRHANEGSTDAQREAEARSHAEQNPGVRFLADVLAAIHLGNPAVRNAREFYAAFPPKEVLEALAQRADLRVKVARAITGSPAALLRRLAPADLATQVELLATEDLPAGERQVRSEEDRSLSVGEIYLKHLEGVDLATYLPGRRIWQYEAQDGWWSHSATAAARALMAAELRSARQHKLVSETEILDLIGDEALERDLPVLVRTRMRTAARKSGNDGRPFRDGDLFACLRSADGTRDLIDELAEHLPLPILRKVVTHAAERLGLEDPAADVTRAEKAEVARPEPAKPDPARPEPAKPEPAKAEPANASPPKRPPARPPAAAAGNKSSPALPRPQPGVRDRLTPPAVPGAPPKGPSAEPASLAEALRDPFASGPPTGQEILAIMEDLAAPDIVVVNEETAETRR
jgi:hypothetical protein